MSSTIPLITFLCVLPAALAAPPQALSPRTRILATTFHRGEYRIVWAQYDFNGQPLQGYITRVSETSTISPPFPYPSFAYATDVRIAAGGDATLMVWQNCTQGVGLDCYVKGAWLSDDGSPGEPFTIAQTTLTFGVTTAGDQFLIALHGNTDRDPIRIARLQPESSVPEFTTVVTGDTVGPLRIAGSGDRALLVWEKIEPAHGPPNTSVMVTASTPRSVLLDAEGRVTTSALTLPSNRMYDAVALRDGRFLLVTGGENYGAPTQRMQLLTLTDHGTLESVRDFESGSAPALKAFGSTALVAWESTTPRGNLYAARIERMEEAIAITGETVEHDTEVRLAVGSHSILASWWSETWGGRGEFRVLEMDTSGSRRRAVRR